MTAYCIEEASLYCPYCGEPITVLVDTSALETDGDQYIEDCQVCCRPIALHVSSGSDGSVSVQGFHENDI